MFPKTLLKDLTVHKQQHQQVCIKWTRMSVCLCTCALCVCECPSTIYNGIAFSFVSQPLASCGGKGEQQQKPNLWRPIYVLFHRPRPRRRRLPGHFPITFNLYYRWHKQHSNDGCPPFSFRFPFAVYYILYFFIWFSFFVCHFKMANVS